MRELIQLNFSGTKYSVLKEEIISVEENQDIHQLPLVQKHIAGIVYIKNRVLILADLCACIGLPPIKNNKNNQIFLISEQDDIAGFAVEDRCNYYSISDDEILSMPDYLKIPIIDKCIIHNGNPIPLINIKILFNHVKQTGYKPSEFEYIVHDIPNIDFDKLNDFRVIECGAETFALPAQGIEENLLDADCIVRLEMAPAYISGIMYYDMKLFPVIHLSSRMKLVEQGKGDRILITDIDGGYGFQIDSQKETINKHTLGIHPLPPIVQSRWMKNAIINNNSIIPVVEPGTLVSSKFDRSDESAVHERYKPDSQFISQIGKEDVEVIEFSLLGTCHSLPKSEVEDTIEYKKYRHIPDVKQIVIGVAEHNGELLPVLDLAMCFGKRSSITPLWNMILISNGDFRAFIVTERVLGTHKIVKSMQRELPIILPNRVVYGCYPDERTDAIRLILNVEALAVYFDKKLVREISEAFVGEPKDANIGIVPDLIDLGEEEEKVKLEYRETGEIGKETIKQAEQEKEYLEKIETVQEEPADTEVSTQEPEIAEDTIPVESEKLDQSDTSEPETEQVEKPESTIEKERNNIADIAQTIDIPQVTEDEKEDKDKKEVIDEKVKFEENEEDIVVKEEVEAEEEIKAEERVEEAKPDYRGALGIEKETVKQAEAEQEKEYLEKIETVQEEPADTEVSTQEPEIAEDTRPIEGEKLEQNDISEPEIEQVEKSESVFTQLRSDSTTKFQESTAHLRVGTDRSASEVEESHTKKYLFIAAIIIISLIFVYIQILDYNKVTTSLKEKESEEQTIRNKQPEEIQKKKIQAINLGKGYKKQKPADFSYEYKEYEVKKGDTLYEITESYTGNGFDYWEVAKENKIPNPDLIFPGQKIRIKVKK